MINLATIPAERLALLETATLFGGAHNGGTGGPDCRHCARELLFEVVTGRHADKTPPGCTVMMAILPPLNDGPWRDDDHRTEVMRPYLRKMLLLDPARDEQRAYAIIDHVYRWAVPEICDLLKLSEHAANLRALAPIVDRKTALAAIAALAALAARAALAALDALAALSESWEAGTRRVLDIICAIE